MYNGLKYTNAGRSNLPHTEIRIASPHITESETQRALEALNPHKAASTGGPFSKALKTLSLYIAPTLSRIFNFTLQTSQITDDWRHAIVTLVAKAPRTADPNLFRLISLTSVVCKMLGAILKEKMLAHLSPWFPPPTLNPGQPPRGRRINYKMARRRECGRPDLSRLL